MIEYLLYLPEGWGTGYWMKTALLACAAALTYYFLTFILLTKECKSVLI